MNAFTKVIAGAALVAATAVTANASPMVGGVAYVAGFQGASNSSSSIAILPSGSDLSNNTSVNLNTGSFAINSNTFGYDTSSLITFAPTQLAIVGNTAPNFVSSFKSVAGFGGYASADTFTFTATSSQVTRTTFDGNTSEVLQFSGTVSDSANYFATQSAFYQIQLGDTGGFVSGSVQFATPNPAPEPATLLILGSGVLGLAAVRRRRA